MRFLAGTSSLAQTEQRSECTAEILGVDSINQRIECAVEILKRRNNVDQIIKYYISRLIIFRIKFDVKKFFRNLARIGKLSLS